MYIEIAAFDPGAERNNVITIMKIFADKHPNLSLQ